LTGIGRLNGLESAYGRQHALGQLPALNGALQLTGMGVLGVVEVVEDVPELVPLVWLVVVVVVPVVVVEVTTRVARRGL
jgi:hypothetical protein